MRSAGTNLYFLDPDNGCAVVEVGCPTTFSGLDSTIDQLETTCLSDTERTYVAGLGTPGTATFTINFDPQDATHQRLLELKNAGTSLVWAIGFPDGTADPTGTTDSAGECEFVIPTSRSWIEFEGFLNSYSFDFPNAGLITSSIGIQVSGAVVLTAKVS